MPTGGERPSSVSALLEPCDQRLNHQLERLIEAEGQPKSALGSIEAKPWSADRTMRTRCRTSSPVKPQAPNTATITSTARIPAATSSGSSGVGARIVEA